MNTSLSYSNQVECAELADEMKKLASQLRLFGKAGTDRIGVTMVHDQLEMLILRLQTLAYESVH